MRISATGRFNSRTGFTLMEILVVLVILSLTVGLTLSGFDSGFAQSDRKMNIRFLQGLLNQIRNTSIVRQETRTLFVEMDGAGAGRYWIESDRQDEDRGIEKKTFLKGATGLYGLQKPGKELQTSGVVSIAFLPQGLAEECRFFLTLDSGAYLAVTLQAVSPRLLTEETRSPGSVS
ncbi:MAG: prepilin-type N-terminal cleavage/methylation domain-containing protein [Desulfohalobiaceae bacterium]|nr:prepilin-type N-terminal cleavage/methylation domain-containing protein [Desulfohalobiaceae bacterium]